MKLNRLWLAVVPATLLFAQAPNNDAGWLSLFDGKTLTGWHSEGDAAWKVAGDTISAGMTGDGWLRSGKEYGNFLLQVEFRNSPKGNSGVFLRSGKDSNVKEKCNPQTAYELQINNEEPNWPTGSIEDVIHPLVKANPAPNEWHRYVVELRGDHIVAHLDGKKVLDGHDSKLKAGFIGLQHHKDSPVAFRAIRIKPLP